ncbi:MFS transporter [Streptomyces caeni]|uniref:MFS transporter n=1 Tax=Streptomyces caeni TaxID=2307231 RepID=A0ABW4IXF7_9ACTN
MSIKLIDMSSNFSPATASASPPSDRRHRTPRAVLVLLVCWLAAFLPMLDTSIVNLALPRLGQAFHLPPAGLGWVTNAYLLPLVVAIPAVGRLGDITDRARLLAAGAGVFALASLGAALASTLPVLLVMRALQGLGASALATMSMAVVSASFPPGRARDRALAWYLSGPAFGGAVGPLAGAALTAAGGWRLMFAAQVPLAVLVAVGGLRLVLPAGGERRSFDPGGIALAALSLLGLSVALLQAPVWGWMSPAVWLAWLLAVVCGAAFAVHERRTPHPLLSLKVFANRSFLASALAGAGIWFGIISGFMLLPLYLENARGMGVLQASLLVAAWPVGALLMYPFAGKAVGRRGPVPMMGLALAVTFAGAVAMVFFGPHTSDAIVVLVGLVLGVVTAIGQVATAVGAVSEFADRDAGVASGVFNTVRQVGSILGGALPMSMLAVGGHTTGAVTYGGLGSAFMSRVAVLGICLVAVYLLVQRRSVVSQAG